MKREANVYHNKNAVAHVISYKTDDNKVIKFDNRSRWAYLIVNNAEAKELLSGNETSKDEILDKLENRYFKDIQNAIQEEESLITYYTLSNNPRYSDHKKIALVSSNNGDSKTGKDLALIAKSYMKHSRSLKQTQEQTISLLEISQEEAKQHLKKELAKNKFIKVTKETLEERKKEQEPYAVISVPYVYNFEDIKDVNSKLIATVKKEDLISSFIEPFPIDGRWTDADKNEILKHNISDKEKDIYFYIKTFDMPDGTTGKLTIIDKDIRLHHEVSSLSFTINNNEAFILIEFDKIKFNIIDLIKEERDKKIELFTKVEIEEFNIEKELAKDKDENLITKCGYYKIGTRSLSDLPYPDHLGMAKAIPALYVAERILDANNKETIHEHIAFKDDENIGFTTAYEQNNKDKNDKNYGMLKTDPELSGIPDTKTALSKYHWQNILGDEDSFKEAIYQVINENRYAVSDSIAKMNESDTQREIKPGKEADFMTFTRIIRYTPEEGKRYELLGANCQDFVQRARDKYASIKNETKSKESLS